MSWQFVFFLPTTRKEVKEHEIILRDYDTKHDVIGPRYRITKELMESPNGLSRHGNYCGDPPLVGTMVSWGPS